MLQANVHVTVQGTVRHGRNTVLPLRLGSRPACIYTVDNTEVVVVSIPVLGSQRGYSKLMTITLLEDACHGRGDIESLSRSSFDKLFIGLLE